jgi:di/tricarboxylate transporter
VQATGGANLIAGGLADLLGGLPGLFVLGALMLIAMACSPFMHNAPTVLVLGPIGVALAARLHLNPDPFLMAVATGAGCDFLTPIGHQSNMLVMGPGGYRFGDYARLGAPLSLLVILLGPLLIAFVWPLA